MNEASTRAYVTVTFLAMSRPPGFEAPLPENARLARVYPCPVELYRHLYNEVGGDYLWWMRRAETDSRLAAHLANPQIAVHILELEGKPAGIAELDFRPLVTVNLSYFGLMRHVVGMGLGFPFLLAALRQAWRPQPRAVTVNTCTADHPRALPMYLRAGFVKLRSVEEVWDIPDRVGLNVPQRLRMK